MSAREIASLNSLQVYNLAKALAEKHGLRKPDYAVLRREMFENYPQPVILDSPRGRLWVDRFYVAWQSADSATVKYVYVAKHLRCGDNGIFCGYPVTREQKLLSCIARRLYHAFPHDGKYVLDDDRLIICQSNAATEAIEAMYPDAEINPLGEWTGGTDVDTGAVNRKLGSDMGDSVTGGGLHGKDLSKADVSVNIYAFLKAQITQEPVEISCVIGDEVVDGLPYGVIVEIARRYIDHLGGFEKFAEWGLIR